MSRGARVKLPGRIDRLSSLFEADLISCCIIAAAAATENGLLTKGTTQNSCTKERCKQKEGLINGMNGGTISFLAISKSYVLTAE